MTVTINETPIHLYPIVNEGIPIGYFVVELKRPISPIDTVVLEQGSALVALKMVNAYSMTDMYYKQCYEFFNELLQYKEPNLLASKSKRIWSFSRQTIFCNCHAIEWGRPSHQETRNIPEKANFGST